MAETAGAERMRARALGITPGDLQPGPLNAITDVDGVAVGHFTLVEGDSIRTGATAILPHRGNLYQEKVPAGVFVMNGYGKLAGTTQIRELGEIETPIVLTNTLSVAAGIEAVVGWTLEQRGNEQVRSVNAVVGETNDSALNDIRRRALTPGMIRRAIDAAGGGPVAEGSVGAGTGTTALQWKGGIGTSSRVLGENDGGYTVGALVQSNFGGTLVLDGIPVGRLLHPARATSTAPEGANDEEHGSIMIVLATDAPLSDRNLQRLARRAVAGLARTGADFSNGSGDYVITFSSAPQVRRTPERRNGVAPLAEIPNDMMTPLFVAAAEATEEAIYNSLLMATTVSSFDTIAKKPVSVEAIPIARVKEIVDGFDR